MILINKIDYKRTIKDYFDNGGRIFVCLFPFYRNIFADHYNWRENIKVTYHLIETVTWNEVSHKSGFNQLDRVAIGLLELNEPFKTELHSFCEQEKLEFPDYSADRIPEVVLIPILEYLKSKNHSVLEMKPFERFHLSETGKIKIQKREVFEIYDEVKAAKYLITENSISILLPDYDCPYMLLSGDDIGCKELIEKAHLETFEVDEKMRFDWWRK
jgi:hypothetical protein